VTTTHDERLGQIEIGFHLIKPKVEVRQFKVITFTEYFLKYTIPSRSIIRGKRWPQSVSKMNERKTYQIVSYL
jgi:hypothetical protein